MRPEPSPIKSQSTRVAAALVALALVSTFTSSAIAAPTDPVTLSLPPEDQGNAFVPGVRSLPLPASRRRNSPRTD